MPPALETGLREKLAGSAHPREHAVDVLFALQAHFGWLTDDAVAEAARLLGMTPLEVDEIATFYNLLYRRPVGRHVIHVCDGTVCWMQGHESVLAYLEAKLGIAPGETTADGLFTLLPVCCIGYCDRAPAMLVDLKVHGNLTPGAIDAVLDGLRAREGEAAP
ncbi:MAG: NADH-quinone oxidoreductase subunit NuoE [Deltaproteobacteria bacterium]|nr:NADH-quinone oxidoreductase subunit NuoE [Deltaproteobacteria bacterium]